MAIETEIKQLNVSENCDGKCENCERYFECELPLKDVFKSKGILAMIRENLKTVKHKVVVLGGKGGVGKSMLTVNLAAALALKGKKVCILDQVYDCPAIPMMLGIDEESRLTIGDDGFNPYKGPLGIDVISTGLILDPDEVIIWYHDMKRNATEELLCAVNYGEIDYLIVDIPAGTSSETVNILKYLPEVDTSVVITVPSGVSQNVARKCIYVLRKANVPIAGIVENMGMTLCPDCEAPIAPLSKGAGAAMSEQEGVPFLGSIPASHEVSSSLDDGDPFVRRNPDSAEAKVVMDVADVIIKDCEGGA